MVPFLIGCNYVMGQYACNCYFVLYNSERTFDRKKKNNGMSSEFLAVLNKILVYFDKFSCGDFYCKSWLSPLDQCHRRKRPARPICFGIIEKMKDLCTFKGRKNNLKCIFFWSKLKCYSVCLWK